LRREREDVTCVGTLWVTCTARTRARQTAAPATTHGGHPRQCPTRRRDKVNGTRAGTHACMRPQATRPAPGRSSRAPRHAHDGAQQSDVATRRRSRRQQPPTHTKAHYGNPTRQRRATPPTAPHAPGAQRHPGGDQAKAEGRMQQLRMQMHILIITTYSVHIKASASACTKAQR
jgi:hypothetical protein